MATKIINPVEYYTSSELKEDLIKEIFCKKKFIKIAKYFVGTGFFLTGTPLICDYFNKIPSWIYILIVIFCVICIFYLLSKGVKNYNDKIYLSKLHHNCTHKLRDIYVNSMSSLFAKTSTQTVIEDTCNAICQEIGCIFGEIKNTKKIGVAIRLAKKENRGIFYTTKGRFGLDFGRERTSEPIPLTTGLPAYLNNNDQTGCLIYHDIFEAAKMNTFKLTQNEIKSHKNEITSLMALPLNCGFSKSRKEMIGILYITSPQKAFFSVHDVDFARNLTDFAAIIITQVLMEFRIYQKSLKKTSPQGK